MVKDVNKILEWGGAILSIAYSLLIASNTGFEVMSFVFFLLIVLLVFLALRFLWLLPYESYPKSLQVLGLPLGFLQQQLVH